ncbi:putative Lymphocyte antigen 75 [Hypsibius exemplaris]|uniref:Lymphocyte antigen 75 n=1 Tax=Hypsibius exemplaris TaxID=2072580 RepID=A0A9X6RNA1_HYPEX|nr:putative Lymphocyte antigen 75 [Hypsibius exemplaris]
MDIKSIIRDLAFFLVVASSTTCALRCPGPDWYYRKATDNCYYVQGDKGPHSDPTTVGIVADRMLWHSAVQECKIRGGKMATFTDAEELKWVEAKLVKGTWYWVGLTYENLRWQWFDGDVFTEYVTMDKVKDPPTPQGTESQLRTNRAAIYFNETTRIFEWDLETVTPYNNNGFICKGTWSSRPWCKVEDGWSFRDGNCYQYNPTPARYDAAERRCATGGGRLLVPSSEEEDNRIRMWMRSTLRVEKAWLGVAIRPKMDNTTVDTVKWADGSSLLNISLNHWVQQDIALFIRLLTTGVDYCGELDTRPAEVPTHWSTGSPAVHDWDLTDACDKRKNIMRPYVCEATLNVRMDGANWTTTAYDDCYQFNRGSSNLKTWADAKANCEAQNAQLAIIKDARQQQFITYSLDINLSASQWINQYWIGLENKGTTFAWIDNTPLDFTNWASSASSADSEKCVHVDGDWSVTNSGKWRTTICTETFNYICQAPFTADIQPEDIIHPPLVCEAPYEKYHDGCYRVVKEPMNRDAAQEYCQRNGKAVLGMVRTFGENNWLSERVTADAWLGLRLTGKTSTGATPTFVYENSDGTDMGEDAFRYYEDRIEMSHSDINDRHCTVMAGIDSQYNGTVSGRKPTRGFWFHAPCTETREFVCSHDGTPKVVDPGHDDHFDPACGAGWFRKGDNCYRSYTSYAPWHLAKQTCQNTHPTADLLWITTREEELFITDFIERNKTFEDDYGESWGDDHWIDFYSDSEGDNWYWPHRDNETNKWHIPMAVTNWALNEPKTFLLGVAKDVGRCALIDPDYNLARWSAQPCDLSHPFICKKKVDDQFLEATPTTLPARPPGTTWGCLNGWTAFSDRCVYLNIAQLNWTEAQAACRAMGGDLSSFHDMRSLLELERFSKGAWIGLNTLAAGSSSPRAYTWSDGSPMDFTPWLTQSHNKRVNCGALMNADGFIMIPCEDRRHSVCGAAQVQLNIPADQTTKIISSSVANPLPSTISSWITLPSSQVPISQSTGRPVVRPEVPQSNQSGANLSGGDVAGLVIGILIAVAIVGAVVFVVRTGRAPAVWTSVKATGSKFASSATGRLSPGGRFAGATNTRYDKASDRVRVADDPEYHGRPSVSYT